MRKGLVNIPYILSAKWLMHPQHAESYYPLVFQMLEGKRNAISDEDDSDFFSRELSIAATGTPVYTVSEYGEMAPPESAPKGSVMVMNIQGAITKYGQFCGGAGTTTKLDLMRRGANNPNIKAIIQVIDSPGGDGMATEFYKTEVQKLQAVKPIITFVSGMACSAGYWLSIAGQHIMMESKTAEVGSIGAYTQYTNFTEFYKKQGIDVRRIYAPQSILKNKPREDSLKGDDKALIEELGVFTDFFITDVRDTRTGISKTKKEIFQGACFYAEDAVELGLADSIGSFDDAVALAIEMADSGNTTYSTSNHNTTMFGNKFTKLSALKGKKASDVTEEEISAANEELKGQEVTSVTLVNSDELANYEQALKDAETAKTTAETALKNEQTAHQQTKDALQTEKEKPGAEPTNPTGKKNSGTDAAGPKNWTENKGSKFTQLAKDAGLI